MNKRQEELLAELKAKFEVLNETKQPKSSMLDLAAITKDMEDAKAMRKEIELHNEVLKKELVRQFEKDVEQVKKELETLGIISVFKKGDNFMRIGRYKEEQFKILFYDEGFGLDYYTVEQQINLPDLTYIGKLTRLEFGIRSQVRYISVKEAMTSELATKLIKKLLVRYQKS